MEAGLQGTLERHTLLGQAFLEPKAAATGFEMLTKEPESRQALAMAGLTDDEPHASRPAEHLRLEVLELAPFNQRRAVWQAKKGMVVGQATL